MSYPSRLLRRNSPVTRALLIASLCLFAPAAMAATSIAVPSLVSSAQAAASSGQGQAVYPATSSTDAPAPSLAVPGGQPVSPDGNLPPSKATVTLSSPAGTTVATATASGADAGMSPSSNVGASAVSAQPQSQMPMTSSSTSTSTGIVIPSPPPPSAFSNDPNQLAAQAEQAALQAQAQADLDQQKKEQQHIIKSYDKASTGLLPLNPDQVRDFMHKLEQTQNAAQFPYEGAPKGQTRIATLSLDPGVEPPQINLATGYVTTITMVDATGEPWPILDVGVGGNFEVSPTQAGTHVVRVMPLTRVGVGDLSVLLKDLPTPVIFRLSAGGPTVDLRYDARIGKSGPSAKPQIIARQHLEAGDETLTLILENAPPAAARRLKVGGLDARTKAWSIGDKVYVRTPLSLLSPAWNASVASGDGTTVYEIGDAPVLLMSDNGAMVRAQISRDDDHDK